MVHKTRGQETAFFKNRRNRRNGVSDSSRSECGRAASLFPSGLLVSDRNQDNIRDSDV
jgi:hypothetical protein